MMKRVWKGLALAITVSILSVLPVYAATNTNNLENDQTQMVHIYDRRGNWIADGLLTISNPRNGKIGIYISTMCHVAVDEIEMDVAVDKNVGGSWEQVDYLSYSFTPKGNEPLIDATVDIQLSGHEVNQTYRLRGTHIVYYNGSNETLDSETRGLTITN